MYSNLFFTPGHWQPQKMEQDHDFAGYSVSSPSLEMGNTPSTRSQRFGGPGAMTDRIIHQWGEGK